MALPDYNYLYDHACERKGGEKALKALLPKTKSKAQLKGGNTGTDARIGNCNAMTSSRADDQATRKATRLHQTTHHHAALDHHSLSNPQCGNLPKLLPRVR